MLQILKLGLIGFLMVSTYPVIDIPNDPDARYEVLSTTKMSNGATEIITRRIGKRGATYVNRHIWCDQDIYRVMAKGSSVEEMDKSRPAWNKRELEPNTIAGQIAQFACED